MCDFPAGYQVEKFERPLDVASGPKTNCTNSASLLHVGWTWLLMCLHIGTKCQMTISFEVKLGSSDDGSGAHHPGDTTLWREGIDPLHTSVDHLDEHKEWNRFEREQVSGSMNALLDDLDLSLNEGDMLVCCHYIEVDANGCEVFIEGLKLLIHESTFHSEPLICINSQNLLDTF